MRALVVGGAGFVGSHLVERLLAEDWSVDVVDNLSSGSLANLADARAIGATLTIHTLDVLSGDFAALVAMRRPDVIFHLAVLTAAQSPLDRTGEAIPNMLSVLEAARGGGVGKVVVALPAGSLYGDVPTRELPVKEGRPFEPVGLRGVLARTIVELLGVYRERDALEHTVLAMSTVYGPRQRAGDGVVAALAAAHRRGDPFVIHGDGRQTRDLLFVDDAVDALARAGQRGGGLLVNVGTGVQTSIRDLGALIDGDHPSVAASRRADDLARVAVSPTRARIQLQWSPWTSVADGLRATLAVDAAAAD